MGCTLLTVCCLPVLILAFITANTKVTTDTSSSQSKEIKTIQTMSSLIAITSEHDPGLTKSPYIGPNYNDTVDNDINRSTLMGQFNCTDSNNEKDHMFKCLPDTTTFSSGIMAGNVTKTIVSYRDFKEYEYYRTVIRILPYAPNIPGIVTNFLTIVVAANIKPLHTSEIYMIVLGRADFIAVVTRCAYYVWSIYITDRSLASCKVPSYIIHLALTYSNMTLMAWTLERFIAVIFPIKLTTWCSVRNTKITLIFILLLSMLLAIPYFTELDVFIYKLGKEAITDCFEKDFLSTIWSHIESFYYIYFPVVCISTCNITILCRLSSMAKSRISMTSDQETIAKKTKENRRMTILLLTISGCFIVLHIPYAINLVFNYFYPDLSILMTEDPNLFAKYLCFSSFGFFIRDFQNSLNFFLYCISGSKFLATFKKIFCKGILKTNGTQKMQSSVPRSTKL